MPSQPSDAPQPRGDLPENLAGAKVRVCLERSIGTRPADLQALPEASSVGVAERDRIAAENNHKVNERIISATTATAQSRRFACSLEVPAT